MRGDNKVSPLGIILGIVWGLSILMIVLSFTNVFDEDEIENEQIIASYASTPDMMLNSLDRKDYSYFLNQVTYTKMAGVTEDSGEIYRKLFAVGDYIKGTVYEPVYLAEGDMEMVEYCINLKTEAEGKMDNLSFIKEEIDNKFR